MLDSVSKWVWLNRDAFGRVDLNKLWFVCGSRTFAKVVSELELSLRSLSVNNLDAFLWVLLYESPTRLFDALTVVFGTFTEVESLDEKFKVGGGPPPPPPQQDSCPPASDSDGGRSRHFSLQKLLDEITRQQSNHLLRVFLRHLANCTYGEKLSREVLDFLNLRCAVTGYAERPWGCAQAAELLADPDGHEAWSRRVRRDGGRSAVLQLAEGPRLLLTGGTPVVDEESTASMSSWALEEDWDEESAAELSELDDILLRRPKLLFGEEREVLAQCDADTIVEEGTILRMFAGEETPHINFFNRENVRPLSRVLPPSAERDTSWENRSEIRMSFV